MRFSDSIKNITEALVVIQNELVQPKKDAINPFHKSQYVTLEAVVATLKDLCSANNIWYTQGIVSNENGVGVQTSLFHTPSGEYIIYDPFYLPLQQQTPQGGASASTYARRYSLCSAFGIVAETDDDGNFSSGTTKKENLDF